MTLDARSDAGPALPPKASPGPMATSREADAATVLGCKRGDEVAFARFVQHYERPVFAVLYRIMGPVPDIEDVAQEVFLRAFRALPRFDLDGPATVTTWLLTIATRLALNDKRRMRGLLSVGVEVEARSDDDPERLHHAAELRSAIERAAFVLPIDQRAAFVLAEFHAMTMAEIATALEIPENTAKTRLFRAREKMKELLLPHWRGR